MTTAYRNNYILYLGLRILQSFLIYEQETQTFLGKADITKRLYGRINILRICTYQQEERQIQENLPAEIDPIELPSLRRFHGVGMWLHFL